MEQVWVKTPEVLARDRLLGSFSVSYHHEACIFEILEFGPLYVSCFRDLIKFLYLFFCVCVIFSGKTSPCQIEKHASYSRIIAHSCHKPW